MPITAPAIAFLASTLGLGTSTTLVSQVDAVAPTQQHLVVEQDSRAIALRSAPPNLPTVTVLPPPPPATPASATPPAGCTPDNKTDCR